jgi:cytoskeletal protein RodZ
MEVIRMDKRYVIWLAPGIVIFNLAFAGCQKKEEPVPAANPAPAAAPAGNASTGGSDVSPGSSATTGETKTPEKQEPSKKTF